MSEDDWGCDAVMWKERIKRMVMISAYVTTGTLIACIFWYGISLIDSGKSVSGATIPYATLWQVLLLGGLCGIETELIRGETEVSHREECVRSILHFVAVTVTALICGYFYGWYIPTFAGILLMCLTSVCIYAFCTYLLYRKGKKTADELNEGLSRLRRKNQG